MVEQSRFLTAACWLLILSSSLTVVCGVLGWYDNRQSLTAILDVPDELTMLALLGAGLSGAVVMSGRRWGCWLFVASAVAIFIPAISCMLEPFGLLWIVACVGLASVLFSCTPSRPKWRTLFGVLVFLLACVLIGLGEIIAFINLPASPFATAAKIIMICVVFTAGGVLLFISMLLDKIHSVAFHTGLALLAATCGTAYLALNLVTIALSPEITPMFTREWSGMLNSSFVPGSSLCTGLIILGICLVLSSRRRAIMRLPVALLGGLAAAALLFLAVDRFATPLWIGCFSADPYTVLQSCSSIIAGHTGRRHLAIAYRERGRAELRLGQSDAAMSDETNAIRLSRDDSGAYILRGFLYQQKQDWQNAIGDDTRAIAINPRIARAYYRRGLAYSALSLWSKAIADFDHASRLAPSDPDIYLERGNAYVGLGQWQQSIPDYTKAIALSPHTDLPWNNRCWSRAHIGQLADALSDCNQAIKLGPDYADSYDSRGFVNLKMKQYDAAMSDYTLALLSGPNAADSLYGRGLAEQAAGYSTASDMDFEKARSIDPDIASQFTSFLGKK